jgi:hypothetical protein
MREFSTGANRNSDDGKYDYEGFLSPRVIEAFGAYMHFNRHLEDGSMRDSDNWQLGIPTDAYMKSSWRHFFDVWKYHRNIPIKEGIVFALCAVLFNTMGYLDELLKEKPWLLSENIQQQTEARDARWLAK